MAHGKPDYDLTNAAQVVYQVSDLGEAVVRLGSIDSFDRRGDVLFLEDFQHGLGRVVIGLGAGNSSAQLSTVHARSGDFSAKLNSGSGIGAAVAISAYLPYPVLTPFGLEASFDYDATGYRTEYYLNFFTGSQQQLYGIRFDHPTGNLYAYGPAGFTQVVASGLDLSAYAGLFHTAKLVVNPQAGTYQRVLFDSYAWSPTGFVPSTVANLTRPHLEASVQLPGQTLTAYTAWVDDLIVTQNEP